MTLFSVAKEIDFIFLLKGVYNLDVIMLKINQITVLLLLAITLFACSSPPDDNLPTAIETPVAEAIQETNAPSSSDEANPYPGQEALNETSASYPGVIEATPTIHVEESDSPLDLPVPPEGLATIGGSVIDGITRQARPESLVYLGKWVYTDQGLPVISLDRQIAPVDVVKPNGEFIFQNVDPGEYAIVFFTPDYSFLLEDEETEESIKLDVNPGDMIDVGKIILYP